MSVWQVRPGFPPLHTHRNISHLCQPTVRIAQLARGELGSAGLVDCCGRFAPISQRAFAACGTAMLFDIKRTILEPGVGHAELPAGLNLLLEPQARLAGA